MARRKRRILNLNEAIGEGIDSIIKEHPRFAEFEEYFLKHIDKKKVNKNIEDLTEKIKSMDLSEEETYKYLQREIADYVSSGEAFDEKGKNIILKNSLEGKTNFFRKFFHRHRFDGEKYMDKTMEAFNDLYTLFKTGDYAHRMPELTKSVATLYDLRFLNPAVDILKEYGLINERKYDFLKKKIYSQTKESSKKVVSGIEKYASQAASVIAIIGIFMVASDSGITGAVIGTSGTTPLKIAGLCMILISLILLFIKGRKEFTKKKIKN